jgi:N6-adenosine-specific RNA methylase IME4
MTKPSPEILAELRDASVARGQTIAFVHVAGYALKAGLDQLTWLLQEERWRQCGFDSIEAFAASIKVAESLKPAIEARKELALLFAEAGLSNRKTARALNVAEGTVRNDRAQDYAPGQKNAKETKGGKAASAQDCAPSLPDGEAAARLVARHENGPDWRTRRERIATLVGVASSMPDLKGYPVLVADPPWRYANPNRAGNARAIENHYPTLPLEDICALLRPEEFADDAILFLWTPMPLIEGALAVMKAWGFVYRTGAVWVKDRIGVGFYFRNQHEPLLVGLRGALPTPRESDRVSSVISAPRGKHSEKPEAALEIIERYYPELPKIELFRRGPARPGWDAWGNEVEARAEAMAAE